MELVIAMTPHDRLVLAVDNLRIRYGVTIEPSIAECLTMDDLKAIAEIVRKAVGRVL